MVAAIDFYEVDVPGELHEPATIIPFPSGWEPEPSGPAMCAVCQQAYDVHGEDTGVCSGCARRLPGVGGCGLAVRLVAGLTAGPTNEPALAHLSTCTECRDFFDLLAETARAAWMEADTATPHAEVVQAAA